MNPVHWYVYVLYIMVVLNCMKFTKEMKDFACIHHQNCLNPSRNALCKMSALMDNINNIGIFQIKLFKKMIDRKFNLQFQN